jgi:hypothetical protein
MPIDLSRREALAGPARGCHRPRPAPRDAEWPKGGYELTSQRSAASFAALARAEAVTGNTVGAENYYQHAEHYFRSMSSTEERHRRLATTTAVITSG